MIFALIIAVVVICALYDYGYVIFQDGQIIGCFSENVNIEEKLYTDYGYICLEGNLESRQLLFKKKLKSNYEDMINTYGTKYTKYWTIYVDNEDRLYFDNETEAELAFDKLSEESSINSVTMGEKFATLIPKKSGENEVNLVETQLVNNYAYSFSKPVKNSIITSRYGYRREEFHTGLDMAVSTGTPIYAAQDGKVIFSGINGNYGNLVKIEHKFGYVTYYAHCSKLLVKEGENVKRGQKIALVGSTGRSTGPHVHFEIRKNGNLLNPYNYIY